MGWHQTVFAAIDAAIYLGARPALVFLAGFFSGVSFAAFALSVRKGSKKTP